MAIDPTFAAAVADWERRLGELHALRWSGRAACRNLGVDQGEGRSRTAAPEGCGCRPADEIAAAAPAPRPRVPPLPAEDHFTPASVQATLPQSASIRLRRRRLTFGVAAARRRFAAAGIGVLAVALVAARGSSRVCIPTCCPAQLRPLSRFVDRPVEVIRTVEVVREFLRPASPNMSPCAERCRALRRSCSRSIFRVGHSSVRRVGATQQSGKDYELVAGVRQAFRARVRSAWSANRNSRCAAISPTSMRRRLMPQPIPFRSNRGWLSERRADGAGGVHRQADADYAGGISWTRALAILLIARCFRSDASLLPPPLRRPSRR